MTGIEDVLDFIAERVLSMGFALCRGRGMRSDCKRIDSPSESEPVDLYSQKGLAYQEIQY